MGRRPYPPIRLKTDWWITASRERLFASRSSNSTKRAAADERSMSLLVSTLASRFLLRTGPITTCVRLGPPGGSRWMTRTSLLSERKIITPFISSPGSSSALEMRRRTSCSVESITSSKCSFVFGDGSFAGEKSVNKTELSSSITIDLSSGPIGRIFLIGSEQALSAQRRLQHRARHLRAVMWERFLLGSR
jgi:hypothetical protein